MTLARVERWLLFATLVAVLFPVSADIGPIGIAPFMISLLALLASWGVRLIHGSPIYYRSLIHFWLLFFVGILLVVSSLTSSQPLQPGLTIWFSGLGLLLYASQNYGRIFRFEFIVALLVFVMIVELGVSLLQIVTHSYIGKATAYFGQTQDITEEITRAAGGAIFRPVGTLSAPNLLGTWLVLGSVVLYAALRWHQRVTGWKLFTYGLLIFLAVVILILSTSRANLAILPLSILALEIFTWIKLRISRWAIAFVILGGFVVFSITVALAAAVAGLGQEISQTNIVQGISYRVENLVDSVAFRLYQYNNAFWAAFASPLMGMGFGNSDQVWHLFGIDIPPHFHYRPHNIYLIVALEAGLLAGLVFVVTLVHLLVKYLCNVQHHRWRDHSIWVGAFALLVLGLVYVTPLSRGLWPLVCFWLGLLMAVSRAPHREISKS